MAIETWVGLLGLALVTGLMFARFSLPTARILFSEVALMSTFNGQLTFMFRVANKRANRILEAQIRVSMLRREITSEGTEMYRFYDLPLVRSQTPVFGLTWMVMHPITPESPFWQCDRKSLAEQHAQVFVTLTGLDETVSQTIHAHHHYALDKLHWNARFQDVVQLHSDGKRTINYDRFHDFDPL
jgi:inward rectifier potassium channel